jgi:tetratricopeptide (TPR) repeat protein
MNTSFVRAAFAASLLCATVGLSASALAADHLSKSVQPTIVAAQKALQAKDSQGALTQLRQAQAISGLTDYDNYIINRLIAAAALDLKDLATADTAEEAAADSPAMPDPDKKAVLHDALEISAQSQHWAKTVGYGQKLAALNGLDADTTGDMAIAYYQTGDIPHAQQYAQQGIDMAKAAGTQPNPGLLQIVMNAQVKQNNEAGAEQTLEQLAVSSGDPKALGQLVDVSISTPGMNDLYFMDLLRLKFLAHAMSPDDYNQLGNAAYLRGYPEEAVNVLQQGGKGGETLRKSRSDAATDERQLPAIAASAAKARTGEQDVKLAEDYWGYGRYAEAEAAARRAIGKGGMKDLAEGQLILGMTLVAQGKYDDAIQALGQVNGNQAAHKTAHLWVLFAQIKKGGATAPAAAH